ncbi:MAG: HD domain-containing phosphohydrolase [Ignavibacteriales bacterium]
MQGLPRTHAPPAPTCDGSFCGGATCDGATVTDVLVTLAKALDLVGKGVFPRLRHGIEVAYTALRICESAGLGAADSRELLRAALVHDTGVSSMAQRASLIEFEIRNPFEHAERGARLLSMLPWLSGVSKLVAHHHDRFDGDNPGRARGDAIPLGSRIIHLADRLTILAHRVPNVLNDKDLILGWLRSRAPAVFDPSIVRALQPVATRYAFWLDLMSDDLEQHLLSMIPPDSPRLSLEDLEPLSRVYAEVIDDKSPFTRRHSAGVAAVAADLAVKAGCSHSDVTLIRVSGFLHDLGKLGVPDEVLDKPGSLSPLEWASIWGHPYDSLRILQGIPVLHEVARWASYHHERLDGSGYPFGATAEEMDLGCRLICVSDVFQALNQARPYRTPMGWDQVARVMGGMARSGRLDGSLVEMVLGDYDKFRSLATQIT